MTDRGKAITAIHVGRVHWRRGHYPEALDQYREALTAFRLMGDERYEGAVLSDLGVVYQYLGRDKEALEHQQMALSLWRKAGDLTGEGRCPEWNRQYLPSARPARRSP